MLVVLNEDSVAGSMLKERKVEFIFANLDDADTNWESAIIEKYHPEVWINDRLDTSGEHAMNVKRNNVKLISFDDNGPGADYADINFGMMPCNYSSALKGVKIRHGIRYFILNEEVKKFRRQRNELKKILVTMGGSDTYGVSVKVAEGLRELDYSVTIITGPSFMHQKELDAVMSNKFTLKNSVLSLIGEFPEYDLAITAGGLTPFEANATGLPCFVIATEIHEIENGKFLRELGSSVYGGFYDSFRFDFQTLASLELDKMSKIGMETLTGSGVEEVYKEIKAL